MALAFVSVWVVLAAGRTAGWLTEDRRVLGVVMLPTAIAASLLALYFDCRTRWMRRVQTTHDPDQDFDNAAWRRSFTFHTNWTAQAIDDVLAASFPASDPPAWTPGLARPAPDTARPAADTNAVTNGTKDGRESDVIAVSLNQFEAPRRAGTHGSVGVAGLAFLLPWAILAVGTPVALGARGLLEAAASLLTISR